MKIIKTKRKVTLQFVSDTNIVVNMELPTNNTFVASDGVVSQISNLFGNNSIEIINDLKELPNKYNNHDLTNKKLLIMREGGLGDLLFTIPALKYLKEKYPTCHIGLSCSPVYHPAFNNHPYINQIYPHIISHEEFSKYDHFLTFEGLIEGSEEAKTVNAYDLFIKNFGIPLEEIKDKNPVMVVSDDVKDYWKFTLKDSINNEKRVGFQLRASSPLRTIPLEQNAQIVQGLLDKGYTVFLIDSVTKKNEVNYFIHRFGFNDNERVVDTSKYSDNFERMAGVISLMSLYVGPDSSGTHIAAALGIPIVGIFGAFRSDVRLKYYKNAIGIDCIAEKCGLGCFAHSYQPCTVSQELNTQYPPCWSLLEIDKVVEAVDELYESTCDINTRKEIELRKMLLNFGKGE